MKEARSSQRPQRRKFLILRRIILLGSVALVGAAVAVGPSAYDRYSGAAGSAASHTTGAHQGPHGLAGRAD